MTFRYATLKDARQAVLLWNGSPDSTVHIENFSSSVFKFLSTSGQPQILRFIDHNQRSYGEVLAELEFVNHLASMGVASYYPIPSCKGSMAIRFEAENGLMTCSSFNFVLGTEVVDSSPYWDKELFRNWGRNLASIHQASRTFVASDVRRWQWDGEHLIKNCDQLIPKEDLRSRDIFYQVIMECGKLAKTNNNYGLIHGDHASNNFIFNPNLRKITAIDFGNCCYHWYLADIGIALSTVRRKSNREEIKEHFLEGYCETEALPQGYDDLIDLFIRLRAVYVYLDRLHRFGPSPSANDIKVISELKERVHTNQGW